MSIVRDEGQQQITCDSCPASLNPWPEEEFRDMVASARGYGWRIEKRMADAPATTTADLFGSAPRLAGEKPQPYTHTCPACRKADYRRRGNLL